MRTAILAIAIGLVLTACHPDPYHVFGVYDPTVQHMSCHVIGSDKYPCAE